MNKFHEVLTEQLSRESSFINDNGDLKKFVIIDAAYNINPRLIELLIEIDELKNKFFIQIKNHWVFDINLFVQYMENKNFLKDSYTRYKNKIGLNIGGKFLNQRNEVSLVWPFKELTLKQQKEILLQILNKNQLYVNLSSIDDEDFKVSDDDKELTKEFYKIENEQKSTQMEMGL
ncbi:MAG: site-specific DNA-methyltransferase [Candidatus Cloacimonadota bacterium]|nr:site-specific DNA-methyltransferase [Candidatus Cloacimonadota bacterium]